MNMSSYSEEQQKLINDIDDYINLNGTLPMMKHFNARNGLRSANYYKKQFDTNKLGELFKKMGITLSSEEEVKYTSFENLSQDNLIEILIDYNQNIGFPIQRNFASKNGLPSYGVYDIKFGSFRNALIIAEIEIPKERERYFDRESLSDDEMLRLLSYYVEQKLKLQNTLVTFDEIDAIPNIPSGDAYYRRFGSISNMYNLIGYDYYQFNQAQEKENMTRELCALAQKLGRTPTSIDIDEMSKLGLIKSASSYALSFGSINDAQIECGLIPTEIGRRKSRDEMIQDLHDTFNKIGRLPAHRDIQENQEVASVSKYAAEFGSFSNALKVAGFKDVRNSRVVMSPKGELCMSSYEYDFCSMLEDNSIEFKKDEYYKDYILNLNKNYQFDFTITYSGDIYFVEIFGMWNLETYRKIANTKKSICLDNNINLIDLYPEDFRGKDRVDIHKILMDRIEKQKRK